MATARGQTAGTFELLRNRRLMQTRAVESFCFYHCRTR